MTARAKPQPMCFMTIGFQHLLVPVDKGLKVMELLQDAVDAEQSYGSFEFRYSARGPLNTEVRRVMAGQIVSLDGAVDTAARGAPAPKKGAS